jgi:hypothetical protein
MATEEEKEPLLAITLCPWTPRPTWMVGSKNMRETQRERDTHTHKGGGEKGMVFAFVSVMGQFFCHSTSKRGCNRSFGQAPIVLELPNCSLLWKIQNYCGSSKANSFTV